MINNQISYKVFIFSSYVLCVIKIIVILIYLHAYEFEWGIAVLSISWVSLGFSSALSYGCLQVSLPFVLPMKFMEIFHFIFYECMV